MKEASRRGFGEGHPDASPLQARRKQAEELTDALQASGYDVLTGEERAEMAALVDVIRDALDANA